LNFEGEYLNGKKWNGKLLYGSSKTIIYEIKEGNRYKVDTNDNLYNQLIFEGEYLNGKKCGYGNEYRYYTKTIENDSDSDNNSVKSFGSLLGFYSDHSYSSSEKNETGTIYFLKFEGEYLFDFKKRGKEYFRNEKLEFEGEYVLNKKWEGKGYDENGNVIYELHNGNGKVKEYDNYGDLIFKENI